LFGLQKSRLGPRRRSCLWSILFSLLLALEFGVAAAGQKIFEKFQGIEARVDGQKYLNGPPPPRARAAFARAFHNLPDEVWLWSSRNLYDFTLKRNGAARHGSFRLDAADKALKTILFLLHDKTAQGDRREWRFGRDQNVKVTQATPSVYVVYFDGKAVVFRLDDHTPMPPGEARIRGGETYVGAVRDETGLGFFRLWQEAASLFFYTLDEARLTEKLRPTPVSDQIRIGARSGFAYYRDRYLSRWILVGVRREDAVRDTFYDGPFDQKTAASFSSGTLIPALKPPAAGLSAKVGLSARSTGLVAGVLVRPYMLYRSYRELGVFDQCAARAVGPDAYYRCLVPTQTP